MSTESFGSRTGEKKMEFRQHSLIIQLGFGVSWLSNGPYRRKQTAYDMHLPNNGHFNTHRARSSEEKQTYNDTMVSIKHEQLFAQLNLTHLARIHLGCSLYLIRENSDCTYK